MQHPIGTETCVEGKYDEVVEGFYIDSIFEPPNGSSEYDGSVERLGIGDVLEYPGYTPDAVRVFLWDRVQFVWCKPGVGFLLIE